MGNPAASSEQRAASNHRALVAGCLICVLAAVGFALLGMKSAARSRGSARATLPATPLQIEPATFDFGEVGRHESKTAKFRLVNTTADEILIDAVAKGCSCSDAIVEPKVIPPGGHAELTVRWKLAGKRGSAAEMIAVHYRSWDRDQRIVMARIVANVRSIIESNTDSVEFDFGTKSTKVVAFTTRGDKSHRITGAATNHGSLRLPSISPPIPSR